MKNKKKLTRSTTDRRIAGVCGGLAEYLGIESTLVRFLFVVLFLFASFGFWPYIILWIILPNDVDVRRQNVSFNWGDYNDNMKRKDVTDSGKTGPQESDWSDF